jgi:hypothetical protein
MTALFIVVLTLLRASIRSRLELAAEILALRHQLAVLQRTAPKRRRLRMIDRLLGTALARLDELAAGPADRDTRHRPAVASTRVHPLLALDFATPPRRSAGTRV